MKLKFTNNENQEVKVPHPSQAEEMSEQFQGKEAFNKDDQKPVEQKSKDIPSETHERFNLATQEITPPEPSPEHADYSIHTEELIKAESNRMISLMLDHIKEINNNLNTKLEELQKLQKNAEIVKSTSDMYQEQKLNEQKSEEPIDPSKAEIIYGMEIDANKEFLNELSKLVNKTIKEKILKMQRELEQDLIRKITKDTKVLLNQTHVSLVSKTLQKEKKKHSHKKKLHNTKEYFYLEDGRLLRSIEDLYNALQNMDDELYNKHVTSSNNDFANWIEYVFKQNHLAERLRLIRYKTGVMQELKLWLEKH